MPGRSELALTQYIKNILEGNDREIMEHLAKYENCFTDTIANLQINEENFSYALEEIANELFSSRSATYAYVVSLFVFSIQLDMFCKCNHSWYQTDILIQTLVNILSQTSFTPTYNTCILLYFHLFLYYFPGRVQL